MCLLRVMYGLGTTVCIRNKSNSLSKDLGQAVRSSRITFSTGMMSVIWGICGLKQTLRDKKSYDKLKTSFFLQGDKILWLARIIRGIFDLVLYRRMVASYRENRSISDYRIDLNRWKRKRGLCRHWRPKEFRKEKREVTHAYKHKRVAMLKIWTKCLIYSAQWGR